MESKLKNTGTVILFSILILTVGFPGFADVESPKKQMRNGISAEDVICRDNLELVIRTNGLAACVRSETAQKMEGIGLLSKVIGFKDLITEIETVKASEREIETVKASEREIETVPASNMSIVNFYITDQDLNLAHEAIEVVSAKGLFEFTVNGITINGPDNIIETGPNTGQFFVKLELPPTVNGKPLSQDDIVIIRYLDESDISGEQRILVKSVPLTTTFAKVQTSGSGSSRIGHEFTVRLYEPDANRDSKDEDKISLSSLEYRGEGGIKTSLANPRFDANRGQLVETGPNTSTFEVKIKIPRELDGKVVHIGDWYEIRYIDRSTPSETEEKIILKGRIG